MYTCGKWCLPYRSDLLNSKHIRCGHTPEKWAFRTVCWIAIFLFWESPKPLILAFCCNLDREHLLNPLSTNRQHPFVIKKDVIVFEIWRKAGFVMAGYICLHTLSNFSRMAAGVCCKGKPVFQTLRHFRCFAFFYGKTIFFI